MVCLSVDLTISQIDKKPQPHHPGPPPMRWPPAPRSRAATHPRPPPPFCLLEASRPLVLPAGSLNLEGWGRQNSSGWGLEASRPPVLPAGSLNFEGWGRQNRSGWGLEQAERRA